MGVPRLSWLAYGLAAALLAQVGSAANLEPIDMLEHEEGLLVARHSDCSKLDLQKSESFLWGGKCSSLLDIRNARLTCITHRIQCEQQICSRQLHCVYAWRARKHHLHGEILSFAEVDDVYQG